MSSPTPKLPSVPKPKSVVIPHPKSATAPRPKPIQWPKLPTPFTGIKPLLFTGGLPVAMSNAFGQPPTGPISKAAAKAVPTIEQQIAQAQKQRMINIGRVEAAEKADKRAQVISRRNLK